LVLLKFRTHGKWILAGEHSVLRGGKALVFPVASRYLDFFFEPGPELQLEIQHKNTDLEMAFWGVLEKALQQLQLTRKDVKGRLKLVSNIPVGAGMGASGTLCVSLARWLTALGHLPEDQQFEFSKQLENLFHGESSGVDVAVALNHQGLIFQRPNDMQALSPLWQPPLYLSYCGKRGITSDCIGRVQKILSESPELGVDIDQRMEKAVDLAIAALRTKNDWNGLRQAITLAGDCFESWGLVSQNLHDHCVQLKEMGALACKPTGSGDGGFVLSLWHEAPTTLWAQQNLTQAL
jgi:mevalonate kinase